MSLYRPSKSEQRIEISQWSIREVDMSHLGLEPAVTRHICGNVYGEGRVCSPIQKFFPTENRCISRSGKNYILVGDPGTSSNAEYVWNVWMNMHKMEPEQYKDVTEDYLK